MKSGVSGPSMARLRALALTAAITLVAVACAQATPSGESNSARGEGSGSQAVTGGNVVPDVAVLDVATGDTVDLGGLIPAERPILLWFWAPH